MAVLVAIPLGLLLLVALPTFFHYRDAHLDFCDGCGSRRYQEQHRIWSADGPSWFGKDDVEDIEESRVLKDWFSTGHQHSWVRSWTERDDGLSGYRATGLGRNTAIRRAYERSPSLRAYLHRQVEGGTLTVDDVRLLLGQPPTTFHSGVEVLAPLNESEAHRLQQAREVVGRWTPAAGETEVNEWQSWADRQPPTKK